MIFGKRLFRTTSCLLLASKLSLFSFCIATQSLCSTSSSRLYSNSTMSKPTYCYERGSSSIAFVTTPDDETARKIARGLIENKLAACVNVIPQIRSIYMWEGKINEDNEFLLMIKTQSSRLEDLTKYVRDNHPYSVAEVITTPIETGNSLYLKWLEDTLRNDFKEVLQNKKDKAKHDDLTIDEEMLRLLDQNDEEYDNESKFVTRTSQKTPDSTEKTCEQSNGHEQQYVKKNELNAKESKDYDQYQYGNDIVVDVEEEERLSMDEIVPEESFEKQEGYAYEDSQDCVNMEAEEQPLDSEYSNNNEVEEDKTTRKRSEQNINDGYLREYEAMLQVNNLHNNTCCADENSSMDAASLHSNIIEIDSKVMEAELEDTQSSITEKSKPHKTLNNSFNATLPRFYCAQCNRDFSTKTNLNRHMSAHAGNKPYVCHTCNKSFSQNGSLKQHMYTHTGEKPFVCEICDRGFTQCKNLIYHKRRHTGELPFQCDHCRGTFRQKDALKVHFFKHHMITEQTYDGQSTYVCTICQKSYHNKADVQKHMFYHVNNKNNFVLTDAEAIQQEAEDEVQDSILPDNMNANFLVKEMDVNDVVLSKANCVVDVSASSAAEPSRAKRFKCRKCFKCFAIKKNLLRHLALHDITTNTIKHPCSFCDLTFDTKYAVCAHRAQQHANLIGSPIQCNDCNMEFSTMNSLMEHLSKLHQYQCSDCPSENFQSLNDLKKHMLDHNYEETE
ncbi:hypothetical protein GQX74_008160 [Glossina fuscipes]|nr:hypothetical protein GQX74_008160 [Glossina fuscipes]